MAHERSSIVTLWARTIDTIDTDRYLYLRGAHEVGPVAALGGTTVQSHLFEQLADLGIDHITLALDNDTAGRDATARSIDASVPG